MAEKKVTRKQLAANRRNARKAGVKTEEGKRRSRLNARKHGIFAEALTERDQEELEQVAERFFAELSPANVVEETLVEKLALAYLKLQRCAGAEAEYFERVYRPTDRERRKGTTSFKSRPFEEMVELVNRYDVSLTNQFMKLLHELERLQRVRAGGDAPAPLAVDVTVSGD